MEIGRKNMLKNELSCNDGKVALSKRYKASDIESRKDALIMESRMVRARSNKCYPHERERINSSSSSPNKCFTTKNLESTRSERQKIRGFDKELSEGDKRLKRAKDSGSRRWQYNSVVRGKLDSTADSHSDTEGVKSTVEMKKSLLNKVTEEETELGLVLKGLGLSRKKKIDSKSDKVARLVKGIWLSIEEEKYELKKAKSELEKDLARAKTKAIKEVMQLKASHIIVIGQLQVETKTNLDEIVEELDSLGRHLMLKSYSEEEVDAIKADTYIEEGEDEEAEVVGVVDGLDGVSRKTVLDNQGDDVVKEMSLIINDLESGLARERETLKALLSVQAKLYVKLDSSRAREDNILMCNREFAEQFDRMKEANENREDQYVKAHFKLKKLNRAISDLTLQVEEKDSEIKKGLEELSEATERAEKLQRLVEALVVKGNQAGTTQYSIQALEQSEEQFRSDLHRCRNELERMRQKFIEKDDELTVARENLLASETVAEHLQTTLLAKDMEFTKCNEGGHVQKGNENLREFQHKLDVALIREKVLEGEIKIKESLVKRKEELLKELSAREELKVEIEKLRAREVDLEALNLAESAKYITKLEEDVIYHDKVDAKYLN
ncbi:hypothetical protein GIB67_009132 [Kingdonia uniflora]|uniref:Uncharacterized protein n=1 Tax=Kingdonia uniflora TaxID=39325 RepID=A0A7J7N263_9MAGN|nr:hypothetical protein GIB67_009132 [Kingdonia uniflora]